MSEHVLSQIWIGGEVPKALLPELIEALHCDEASDDVGGAVIAADCDYNGLMSYVDSESLLNFYCERAPNGEFERTENFCVKHGIAFDRHHESGIEFDGEDARFRPGMNAPVIQFSDYQGNEVVCGDTVRQALTELIKGNADAAKNLLLSACPNIPDELKEFNAV